MSQSELEELYLPYHNQKQSTHKISKNVVYLGNFVGFGEVWAKQSLWSWKKQKLPQAQWGKALFRSQAFQEKALDATLADLKDCVVLSTTPSYYSQFQNACLLKSRGFKLVGGKCYRHPGYPELSDYRVEHPGIPDRYWHWEHLWYKHLGPEGPKELGLAGAQQGEQPSLANCGAFTTNTPDEDTKRVRTYLGVGWLKRGVAFPEGWKRFHSSGDYKLGHNFELLVKNGGVVQDCPHKFDLKIFEGWEPDFAKWSPA